VGKIGPEQNEVASLVFAKAVANYPLAFTVADERELKFGMIVPVKRKGAFDPLVRGKGSERFPDFLVSSEHQPNINTITTCGAKIIANLPTKYMFGRFSVW
jgi:hypothetical protein